MKKIIIALTALLLITVKASAMSYEQARDQALFLTDKMAYELNLTEDQYEAAYEINLDYLMSINDYDDLYGSYWNYRNTDLSYILYDWQYQLYCDASYFYRPLYWNDGYWHFGIYARYPHRDYYYFGRPSFYASYYGGHSWRNNGGRSWYNGHQYGRGGDYGMRDGWDRGDFNGRGGSNRNWGNNGNGNNWNNDNRGNNGNGSYGNRGFSGYRGNNNNNDSNGNRGYNSNNGSNSNSGRFSGHVVRPNSTDNARYQGGNFSQNERDMQHPNTNFSNRSTSTFGNNYGRESSTRTTVTRGNFMQNNREYNNSESRPSSPNRTFTPSRSSNMGNSSMQRQSSPSTHSFSSGNMQSSPSRSNSSSQSFGGGGSHSSSNGNGGGHFGGRR